MKTISLYQVYDNVGQTMITQPIPCANNLVAALGFYNSYILEKDKNKNPFQYKALDLIRLATFEVDDIGTWSKPTTFEWSCSGADIKQFISSEMASKGVDDFFEAENIDEEEKE